MASRGINLTVAFNKFLFPLCTDASDKWKQFKNVNRRRVPDARQIDEEQLAEDDYNHPEHIMLR